MPQHWSKKGHYGYIIEGELEIEFANEKIIYKKGDGVFIPDGAEHKHWGRAITETVQVIFVENKNWILNYEFLIIRDFLLLV